MLRNLILTGGIGHDFEAAASSLRDILAEAGIASEITTDLEAGCASLAGGAFDLVTVYALRWRMLGSDKYAPHRARFAFTPSAAARRALTEHVAAGRGLLGLHTACICFDDWPEWKDLLGGIWQWGSSFHPPCGPVEVRKSERSHVITDGVSRFRLTRDEVYSNLDLASDIEPLLVASAEKSGETTSGSWPVLWARQVGRGRVVYDALGHDKTSLDHPAHRQLLCRSALWSSVSARTI